MAWTVMYDVMQWVDANGDPASGYVVKAYLPGTTTATSIAIDKNGGSPQATITLNAEGKPEVSGNEVMLFIDRDYKWAVFENASDAAANSNPYAGFYDNIPYAASGSSITYGNATLEQKIDNLDALDYTELRAITTSQLTDNDSINVRYRSTDRDGAGGLFNWDSSNLATEVTNDPQSGVYVAPDSDSTGASGAWVRNGAYTAKYVNVCWFGVSGDDSTVDQTTKAQAAIDWCDLDKVESNYHQKALFFPTPLDGYKITGLNAHQRVGIIGEDKWNCRFVITGQGDFGIEQPRRVSNIHFDGVAVANGANRIDEAAWSRATDRANTGVIMGPADQAFQGGHGIVEECRFTSLGVSVERGDCIDTTIRGNYILGCWHGIFSRADGSKAFSSMLYDVKNYISQNSGIGIGFYTNANGYSQWSCEGNVVEVCCTDVAHDGVHGFIDSGGASFITPGARQLYIEGDESVYPNSIGIRANLFFADGFVIQGVGTPLKVSGGTNSFWRLVNGQIFETVDTYDITFPTGGRNLCQNVAFSNGLNPSGLGNTTLIDCSGTNVLPDGNSNHWIDDGEMYVGNQGSSPLKLNRRSTNGYATVWQRQGLPAQEMDLTISSTSVLDSGTTDGTTANKLIDSTQNFTSTVTTGAYVKNTTDDTFAIVTAVDSNTSLSLDSDIMVSGEGYQIFNIPVSRFSRPQGFESLTVPELSKYSASTHVGCAVMVSDEAGGYTMAFSNGTNWVRCQDLATVS